MQKKWCWTLTFCYIWKLTQNKKPERKQDGRVEGHGVYLFPQIHQKFIYIWSSSHWIPTECRQKIFYNPNCKKDQHIKWEEKMVMHHLESQLGQRLRGECTSRLEVDSAEKDQPRCPCQLTTLPSPSHAPAGVRSGECCNLSFNRQTQGQDLVWLCGDSPKGLKYDLGMCVQDGTQVCHRSTIVSELAKREAWPSNSSFVLSVLTAGVILLLQDLGACRC